MTRSTQMVADNNNDDDDDDYHDDEEDCNNNDSDDDDDDDDYDVDAGGDVVVGYIQRFCLPDNTFRY